MTDKTVYLSGGIEGLTWEESNAWREYFVYTLENMSTRLHVFNPNSHFTMDDLKKHKSDPAEVMEYDLHRLRKSDVVVVNFNNVKSLGTMAEIAIAYEHRIPIIGYTNDVYKLHDWQIIMCQKILPDEESVVEYLIDHFINDD